MDTNLSLGSFGSTPLLNMGDMALYRLVESTYDQGIVLI